MRKHLRIASFQDPELERHDYSHYELDTSTASCRICFEPATEDHPLITPCKCAGSVRYVHEDCLKTWVVSAVSDIATAKCELCHADLKMQLTIVKKCAVRESLTRSVGTCLFVPLLLSILAILMLITYLLSERYVEGDISADEKGYTIALMIACSIAGIVILYMIFRSLRDTCVVASMEQWTILSQDLVPDSKAEANDVAEQTHVHNVVETSVMLVPHSVNYSGVRVQTPQLAPMSLTPINRNGRLYAFSTRPEGSRVGTPNSDGAPHNRRTSTAQVLPLSLTMK